MWHVTCDMWHKTHDSWHVTCALKFSDIFMQILNIASRFLWQDFSVLKLPKRFHSCQVHCCVPSKVRTVGRTVGSQWTGNEHLSSNEILAALFKTRRGSPVFNRASNNKFHHLVNKKKVIIITCDTGHMKGDMWHMRHMTGEGGEPCLKILALYL